MAGIRERLSRPLRELDIQVDEPALQDLEQRFAEELAVLASAQHRLSVVVAEREKQSTRRREAPEVLARARRQLVDLDRRLQESDLSTDATELGMALRLALEADRRAIVQQIDLYQKAVVSYELRRELLIAQRGDARRQVDESRSLVSRLQEIVDKRRLIETRRRADEARAVRVETEPVLEAIADENQRLAELPTGPDGIVSEMTQMSTRLQAVSAQLERLESDFRSVRSKVTAVGRTNAIGYLLRKEKAELPEIKPHLLNRSRLGELIREVQLQQIQFEEQRDHLLDRFEERVAAVSTRLSDSVSADRLLQMTIAVRDLFQARLRYLEILAGDYDDYFSLLVELDLAERHLIETTRAYSEYIAAMVLWTPSAGILSLEEVAQARAAAEWLFSAAAWRRTLEGLAASPPRRSLSALSCLLALILFFGLRRRLRARLVETGRLRSEESTPMLASTVRAALLTLSLALAWPSFFWLISFLLQSPVEVPDVAAASGQAIDRLLPILFLAELLRWTCFPSGLGQVHFGFSEAARRGIRSSARTLLLVVLPLLFFLPVFNEHPETASLDGPGRLAYIVAMLALAWTANRLVNPATGVLAENLKKSPTSTLARLRYLWYPLAMGIPFLLAATAFFGYSLTSLELLSLVFGSLWVVVAASLLYHLVRHLVLVMVGRAASSPSGEAWITPAWPGLGDSEKEVDLERLQHDALKLVRGFFVLGTMIPLWFAWTDVLPALGYLRRVQLWEVSTGTGVESVSVAALLLALAILLLTFVAVRNVRGLTEIMVRPFISFDQGARVAITAIIRYILVVLGLVGVSAALEISWSSVQWMLAAVSVGLGFGLQEVFANFVSGLILLFERPIRVGDIITVAETTGTVTEMKLRATTITDRDRRLLIVPNRAFITGNLVNWTLKDPTIRIRIPVGLAYGSDTSLAHKLLLEVAERDPHVLPSPPPKARFCSFGDDALEFILFVYIPHRDRYRAALHSLHSAIDRAFRENGLEIAFPQRDIHLDSNGLPMQVRLVQETEETTGKTMVELSSAGSTAEKKSK